MKCNATDRSPNAERAQPHVVVIGYGSPIRGDDAVGPIVADSLREQLADQRVEIISRHVLTAELAEPLRAATLVVFVDAAVTGDPGQIVTHCLQPNMDTAGSMAHTLDAEALLGWVRGLYGTAPRALLVSTRGASFEYANYRLTPVVQAMIDPMIRRIQELVHEHLDAMTHS